MLEMYKSLLPSLPDYITHEGEINWEIASDFIKIMAMDEIEEIEKNAEVAVGLNA
jgi:5'-3' exonuclease